MLIKIYLFKNEPGFFVNEFEVRDWRLEVLWRLKIRRVGRELLHAPENIRF